jgi:hypothetical protein
MNFIFFTSQNKLSISKTKNYFFIKGILVVSYVNVK